MSGEFFPLGVDEPLVRDDGESFDLLFQKRGRVPEKSLQLRLTHASVPSRRRVS